MKLIELETKRLKLRQWCLEDLKPFAALNADMRVMEFFPAPLTLNESDAMANRCRALIAERGWGFWAVEKKGTGNFMGFVGLHIPIPELSFSPCVEVGWRLAFQYWGKGYATEAAKAALSIGFKSLVLPEVVSFTPVGNIRSRAVMERLGMKLMPQTFEHPSVSGGSDLREHCLYRLPFSWWAGKNLHSAPALYSTEGK